MTLNMTLVCMYFLCLARLLHCTAHQFFNRDKTVLLFMCYSYPYIPPFLIISHSMAKLNHPCSHSTSFNKRKHIDLSILFRLTTFSLDFPVFHCLVIFCLIICQLLPSSLRSSFTHIFMHKMGPSAQKYTYSLKLALVLQPCFLS